MKRELQRIEIPGEYDARRRTWEVVRAAYLERRARLVAAPPLRSLALAAAVVGDRRGGRDTAGALGREHDPRRRRAREGRRRSQRAARARAAARAGPPARPVAARARGSCRTTARAAGSGRTATRRGRRAACSSPACSTQRDLVALEPQRQGALGEAEQAARRLAALVVRGLSDRLPRRLDAARDRRRRDERPRDRPGELQGRAGLAAGNAPGRVRRPRRPRARRRRRCANAPVADAAGGERDPRADVVRRRRAPARPRRPERQRLPRVGTCRRPHADARPLRSGRVRPGLASVRTDRPGRSSCSSTATRCASRTGPPSPELRRSATSPGRPTASGSWSSWPAADQLVFVRVGGKPKLDAVSNVSRQFRSRTFPGVAGWTVSID